MVLSSINGPTNTTSDLIIGEEILSQNGNTIGIVAEKLTHHKLFLYTKIIILLKKVNQ
jgi:hypothetical protein